LRTVHQDTSETLGKALVLHFDRSFTVEHK